MLLLCEFDVALGVGVGVGVGVAGLTTFTFCQTNLLPIFTHLNSDPFDFTTLPTLVHLSPVFTAAKVGVERRERMRIVAIATLFTREV